MFKKRLLMLACAGLLVTGLAACGSKENQDYEQSDGFEAKTLVVSAVGAGDMFSNWDPAASAKNPACLFSKIDSSHYQLTVKGVPVSTADNYVGFKIVQDGSWSTQYGVEDMDWNKSTAGFVKGEKADYKEGTSNRSNFEVQISGDVTIDFYPYYFLEKGAEGPLVITVK